MVVDQMHFPLDTRKVRNVHFTNAIQIVMLILTHRIKQQKQKNKKYLDWKRASKMIFIHIHRTIIQKILALFKKLLELVSGFCKFAGYYSMYKNNLCSM